MTKELTKQTIMEDTKKENWFTEQGRETPVPVGLGSVQAGSARPSSSVCLALAVGDQAAKATGTNNSEGDPFRKKGIPRTPPQRDRVYSCPSGFAPNEKESTEDIPRDRRKKFEKEEKNAMDMLGKHIMNINAIVKDARNIHKTIRDSITAAVIYYHRAEEYRNALIRAKDEQVNEETVFLTTPPAEKQDKYTQCEYAQENKEVEEKKRSAQSPLEMTTQGKKRARKQVAQPTRRRPSMQSLGVESQEEIETDEAVEWKKVESRKVKKKPKQNMVQGKSQQKRRLPEAVAVRTKTLSYIDALKTIKSKVDPDKLGVTVSGIRQTRGGEILIEIKKGSGGVEALRSTLAKALGEEATVRTMDKTVALDVRDIDGITDQEGVVTAVKAIVGDSDPGSVKVQALRKGFGETQVAVVTMSSRAAEPVLKAGRIKIGWVMCRVRERIKVLSCFRCLGFGHIARECKGPDHSKTCRLCGKDGHIAKNCKEKPFCMVCSRCGLAAEHIIGSKNCEEFQKELKKVRQ